MALAASLVFLVPFDAARNIDMQGVLLIVSGGFAWAAILLERLRPVAALDQTAWLLLGIFIAAGVISFVLNPHAGYDFFGAPYIRLGIGSWLACVGVALLCAKLPKWQLVSFLYGTIMVVALISLPYTWLCVHSLFRAGGVFSQADILACFVGCGLLLGLEIYALYPKHRRLILACQILMAGLLLLTQTRAVIFLTALLGLLWIFQHKDRRIFWHAAGVVAGASVLLAAGSYAAPGRLTDSAYASRSFDYRLTLQRYAGHAAVQKPFFGYGPGNLADAMPCPALLSKSLQTTCDEGYFFNSSHNIFLDRALGVGLAGGLAFLALVLLGLYRGFHGRKPPQVWVYGLALISAYYLTNVTTATLELLLWVLLFQCLVTIRSGPRHA